METYEIPAQNFDELRQKIDRLDRRARKLGSAPISLLVKGSRFEERWQHGRKRAVKLYEVAISGEAPKLAGWEFLARIDTTTNIIFSVPGTDDLPERFRDTDGRCDHCGTRRQRKAVFVVRNDAGQFKQIGRNCLRDFLGHKNPDDIARMLEYFWQAVRACEGGDDGWGGSSMPNWDSADLVLALTAAVIRQHGWVSRGYARENEFEGARATADRVGVQLYGPTSFSDRHKDDPIEPTEADWTEANETIAWVSETVAKQPQISQYEHNLIAALEAAWVDSMTLGLACSAVPGYQRHIGRQRERKAREAAPPSRHFGEPGRREVFTLTLLGVYSRESNWGTTYIHRFADSAGSLAVWFASGESAMQEGLTYEVKATVKRHGEFAGKAQTILSRAAMVREIPTAA